MGHQQRLPPPRLNGRCRFSERTFAGTPGSRNRSFVGRAGNQRDAICGRYGHVLIKQPVVAVSNTV
jgi:hypothetical protein